MVREEESLRVSLVDTCPLSKQGKARVEPGWLWGRQQDAGWAAHCAPGLGAQEKAEVHSAPDALISSCRTCHPVQVELMPDT